MPIKRKNVVNKNKRKYTFVSTPGRSKDSSNPDYNFGASVSNYKENRRKTKSQDTDEGGVRRIYSPFTKIRNNKIFEGITYNCDSPPSGLNRKEKCYIITSCQTKFARYHSAKQRAAAAKKYNKIFTVYGNYNPIRKALLERGWIERITESKMNLSKIRKYADPDSEAFHNELERLLLSSFVERCIPGFVWYANEDPHFLGITTDLDISKDTIINKLKLDAVWTSKQGLCTTTKQNYWHYIEDVSEINIPRTYSSFDAGEVEDFTADYKITACTSLLKWIISMVANERPVFVKTGTISMNVVVFALNRCKEYLFTKQNRDIDTPVKDISSGQWNSFVSKYYSIIAKINVFQEDKENKLPLYLIYAKFLLQEMHRYRPQLSCEGCHNIWIIKPAHCSRGRGIRMASKLGVIKSMISKANVKYVIQKYIEEPLLVHDTKFDIRQYYLVTSTYPLVIWMYKDCYLKFSSQKYNLKNFHESIHLTNNAVQKKYNNCTGRHTELPQNNMWQLCTYKEYLNRIGRENVWENIIYTGMKKNIIGIMLGCQDSLSFSKNCFELYGCDFILDKEYKPWLIEINSNPDLHNTTTVTEKICPAVLADIIKVVIDRAADPKALTGEFHCIYRQPLTIPHYGGASDLIVKGTALPLQYFYRGNVELKEYYDNGSNIDTELDIKAILEKLKNKYNADSIMKQPEDDSCADKTVQETSTHGTWSEYELNLAATVINAELDNLIDRITLGCDETSKSMPQQLDLLVRSTQLITDMATSNNIVTDSQNKLKLKLSQAIQINEMFNNNDHKKTSYTFSDAQEQPRSKKNVNSTAKDTCQSISTTTERIITFLNEKEIEYKKDYARLGW